MRRKLWQSRFFTGALAMAAIILFFLGTANATTFSFTFNNTSYDDVKAGIIGPTVGTGTLSFDEDYGEGEYLLDDLTNLAFSASFIDGSSFTLADSEDPLDEVNATITSDGTDLFLRFDNVNFMSGGLSRGAIDLIYGDNMNNILSFSPLPSSETDNFYATMLNGDEEYFGTFEAVAVSDIPGPVPEPATLLLLGTGIVGLAGFGRKYRKS